MRAAWRLATRSAFDRPARTVLLVLTVACSAALISAVSFSLASVNRALQGRMEDTIGAADARLKPSGIGGAIDAALLPAVSGWPEVGSASGRAQAPMSLQFVCNAWTPSANAFEDGKHRRRAVLMTSQTVVTGLSPGDLERRPPRLVTGRLPAAPGEIVLDTIAVTRLSAEAVLSGAGTWAVSTSEEPEQSGPDLVSAPEARALNARAKISVGSVVRAARLLRKPVPLTVVGIAAPPPLGGRAQGYMTLDGLSALTGQPGKFSQIDIVLKDSRTAPDFVERRRADLPPGTLLETSEKITSGVDRNIKSNQLGLVLASVMAFLSASFIIGTGMTTRVTEKQRELAILRCIGAARSQLAGSQLSFGAIVGALGAIAGVPAGVLIAFALTRVFREEIPGGMALSRLGLVLAPGGALLSGVLGAAIPAWQASRVSPLAALAARSVPPRRAWTLTLTAIGLACLAVHMACATLPRDGQVAFWLYATLGLPLMFTGYFILGVPVASVTVSVLGGTISRLLRLPPRLLERTIRATPYRHGFTAGAMMGGLALMVAIWTHGSSIMRDWLGRLEFPDAFVTGIALTPDSQRRLNELPFVAGTCAIALHPVQTDAFGVRALQKFSTTFVAFEPRPFFEMTNLTWIEGDEAAALRRLEEGGAVIVAREFKVAQGLGAGDTFRCSSGGRDFGFEIVGVVTSPGLEIVSKYFNIGDEFEQQSLHAVFGSRKDLREKFNSEAIQLIQIALKPDGDPGALADDEAVATIRRELFGAGILDAGSGRAIKREIESIVRTSLLVSSTIALGAMLVASFGVANLIAAGIIARRFEFGVLRAVGAGRGLVARLVLGEAVVVALAAGVLGTLMGFEGAFTGRRLDRLLLGIELTFQAPWAALWAGWGLLTVICLASAAPAVVGLARKRPRELLAAQNEA